MHVCVCACVCVIHDQFFKMGIAFLHLEFSLYSSCLTIIKELCRPYYLHLRVWGNIYI